MADLPVEGGDLAKDDNIPDEGAIAAVRAVLDDLLKDVTELLATPQASLGTQIQGTPYSIFTKLGGGSDAFVFVGKKAGSEQLLAIKLEKQDKDKWGVTLWSEYSNYLALGRLPESKRQGFCSNVKRASNEEYKVLVMELLGPSLKELMLQCDGKLSLPTVLRLAEQMLHRIETLHSTHKVHGNVKPENFVIGRGKEQEDTVFCIDLGDTVTYWRNGKHVPWEQTQSVNGNPNFMCVNGHENVRKSRRSDIESLAYTLIYLLQGSLPWSGLGNYPKSRQNEKRLYMKLSYGRGTKVKTKAKAKSASVHADQPPKQATTATTASTREDTTNEVKNDPNVPEGTPVEVLKSADCPLPPEDDKEASDSDEEVPGEFFDLLVRLRL